MVIIALFSTAQGQDFFEENGTIFCTDAEVGDTGEVNGTVYTKRTKEEITSQNASTTCTSGVTDMRELFSGFSNFNEEIGHWDVSSVTTMRLMFYGAHVFNQPIGNWDVSSVTEMRSMFNAAFDFNQDIGNWDVSSVEDMFFMFSQAESFNQDIGSWDVSSVTTMLGTFRMTDSFNQPIEDWDVSNVTNMAQMFNQAKSFNQPIGNWDVSSVTQMQYFLRNAESFNQDLSGWCVENFNSEPNGFAEGTTLEPDFFPIWGTCMPTNFDDEETGVITKFELNQNYPNPFNPTTQINYSLPEATDVRLEVYNLLGQRVQVLVNGRMNAGQHTVTFDASRLSSGMYIYRLVAGNAVKNRSMMLVK